MATVLVVDDDRDTCDLLARYLARSGHNAVCAGNGWEALLALDKYSVELILLDVMMPGMDGEKFLQILRSAQKKSDTAVVVVTALGRDTVESRLAKLGVSDVLSKDEAFFRKVTDVVERHLGGTGQPQSVN
jgi:DNA-binding response OmpR family regulator